MKFIKSLICNYLCINNLHKVSKIGVNVFKKENYYNSYNYNEYDANFNENNNENNNLLKFCSFKKTKMHYLKNNIYFDIYNDSMLEINKQLIISESKIINNFNNYDYNKYNDLTAEHIFPQSFLKEYSKAKFDMHNIYLTKGSINSNRSNYKFIQNLTSLEDIDENKKESKKQNNKVIFNKIKTKFKNNNKILKKIIVKREKQYKIKKTNNFVKIQDTPNYKNNKLKLFIPHEESRGAIARSLAYMKYTYPNLELDKVINSSTLIEWNCAYPPTNIERIQNEVIKNIQGNYNIFILNHDLVNEYFC
jgi:endonuclease I